MNTRRAIGALMIASLALFASACSSDSDGSDSKTTTTKAADTTTTAPPLTDEEYSAAVAEISANIAAAGTDLCAISTATSTGPPEATTKAQVKETVDLYSVVLNAVAGALPPESATSADALRTAAVTLQSDAEAADYPLDFLSGSDNAGPAALTTEAVNTAMTDLQAVANAQCAPAATTTVPAG